MSELIDMNVMKESHPATATTRVMTVVLEGELDRAEAEDVVAMLARLCENGLSEIVIDFAGVTHFDYRAVKPLVRRAEVLREAGGDLKLSGMSPYLHAIFRSAGAHDAFDYFAAADQAVRSFDRGVLLYG
jgi:anti-sigma B factor antagonist